MSLLMDALRKAEEAKRNGEKQESEADSVSSGEQAGQQREEPSFTLEPREDLDAAAERPQDAPATSPSAEQDIETIPFRSASGTASGTSGSRTAAAPPPGFDFANPDEFERYRAGDRKPPRRPERKTVERPVQDADQIAAAAMFEAKLPPEERKSYMRLLLSLLAIIFCAGTGVLLYLLNAPSSSSILVNPGVASNPARGFLEDRIVPEEQSAPAASVENVENTDGRIAGAPETANPAVQDQTAEPQSPPQPAPAADRQPPPVPQLADSPNPATDRPQSAPAAAAAASPGNTAAPATPAPEYTLVIERKSSRPGIDPELEQAYSSFRNGELATAATQYRGVIDRLPNNRDALLGLASIHSSNGEPEQARALYLKILTLNPRDPIARTGLLQSMQGLDAAAYERQLKALLSDYPDQAALHFALGNLYAGQRRWSDAQAAYFEALLQARRDEGTPVSPDYAFNLAVSLEQLQKPGPALQYYREARELAAATRPGFDPARLAERLRLLERSQP